MSLCFLPQSTALSARNLFKIGLSTKGFSTYHFYFPDKVNQLKLFIKKVFKILWQHIASKTYIKSHYTWNAFSWKSPSSRCFRQNCFLDFSRKTELQYILALDQNDFLAEFSVLSWIGRSSSYGVFVFSGYWKKFVIKNTDRWEKKRERCKSTWF